MSKTIKVYMTDADHRRVKMQAASAGVTLAAYVLAAVLAAVQADENKDKEAAE